MRLCVGVGGTWNLAAAVLGVGSHTLANNDGGRENREPLGGIVSHNPMSRAG